MPIGAMLLAAGLVTGAIHCGSRYTRYQVAVSGDHKKATLTRAGLPLRFGVLACWNLSLEGPDAVFLVCRSEGVADAGYQTTFFEPTSETPVRVHVDELWLGGVRHLESSSCRP